jgi:tricorn protease-like protein
VVVRHEAKALAQVTKFTDFDVKTLDAGAGAVVFEQAGYIHELDPRRASRRSWTSGGGRLPVDDAALGGRHEPR